MSNWLLCSTLSLTVNLWYFCLLFFLFLFKEVALGRSNMRCTEFSLLYVLNRAEKATVSALTLTLHSLLVTWMHEAPLLVIIMQFSQFTCGVLCSLKACQMLYPLYRLRVQYLGVFCVCFFFCFFVMAFYF